MIRPGPALALALAAAPASAATGGEGSGEGLFYPFLNLAILLLALIYFGRRPIVRYFAERRDAIRSDLSKAAELYRRSEENHARWQRRLVDLEREIEEIRATAVRRAESEGEHILGEARAAAERIRRDAGAAVDQELRRARGQLRQEAADLAVELARDLLRERVTDQDRSRLLDEFIERIERAPGAGAPGNGR